MTQQPDQHQHPHRWIALLIALLAIVGSTLVLYLAVWEHGVKLIPSDSLIYLRSGMNFFSDEKLGIYRYKPTTEHLVFVPTTHYPPLVPLIYTAGIALGMLPTLVPSIVAVSGWVLLLLGIGAFVYQSNKKPLLAALAIILATLTYGFWYIFQIAMSEVVFLPLLIWLMVVLVDLPIQPPGVRRQLRLVVAALLLALLMLTRHVGVFVLAAVLVWWAWHWWSQKPRHLARLLVEGGILASSALPAFVRILFHHLQTDPAVGHHLSESHYTFTEGVAMMVWESSQILLPGIHISNIDRHFHGAGLLVYPVLLGVAAMLFRFYGRKHAFWVTPPRSPILIFLLFYTLLYTVVQPFLSFWPMDTRDMSTMLCLTIPWTFAWMSLVPPRWSYSLLASYIALNFMVSVGPTLYKANRLGVPDWVSFNPPHLESIANRNLSSDSSELSIGFLGWLTVKPYRVRNLTNHHPKLLAWLRTLPQEKVILSNEPILFTAYQIGVVEDISKPFSDPHITTPEPWLETGDCVTQQTTVIVLFDWYKFSNEAKKLQKQIETKCPDLPKYTFQHSVAYKFPPASLDNPSHTSHD